MNRKVLKFQCIVLPLHGLCWSRDSWKKFKQLVTKRQSTTQALKLPKKVEKRLFTTVYGIIHLMISKAARISTNHVSLVMLLMNVKGYANCWKSPSSRVPFTNPFHLLLNWLFTRRTFVECYAHHSSPAIDFIC